MLKNDCTVHVLGFTLTWYYMLIRLLDIFFQHIHNIHTVVIKKKFPYSA